MKKVILLGANGHTAREIIPRLMAQGDVELTLFARNATPRATGHIRTRRPICSNTSKCYTTAVVEIRLSTSDVISPEVSK
ncbi:hypothetical protein [Burkholderia singularis]|uniref:NAD(P)-binding domain-containing protein n=1 Tax=Burkholderia singularis TaxID=1503053 RepID=A0A238GZG6_9BURK|nr:hypothetical protein [Burkholderia singularis]SMF98370.1 hypothetical protein BSIN_5433 [Burkholderia singularis]